jgi:type II secretory pathway pseudopilin PulG
MLRGDTCAAIVAVLVVVVVAAWLRIRRRRKQQNAIRAANLVKVRLDEVCELGGYCAALLKLSWPLRDATARLVRPLVAVSDHMAKDDNWATVYNQLYTSGDHLAAAAQTLREAHVGDATARELVDSLATSLAGLVVDVHRLGAALELE